MISLKGALEKSESSAQSLREQLERTLMEVEPRNRQAQAIGAIGAGGQAGRRAGLWGRQAGEWACRAGG